MSKCAACGQWEDPGHDCFGFLKLNGTPEGLKDYYYEKLEWCGCADSWGALKWLGDLLDAIARRHTEGGTYEEPLEMLGINDRPQLAHAFLYTLDHYGLIEHGSIIRGCWLTEEGEKLKESIKACSEEEFKAA